MSVMHNKSDSANSSSTSERKLQVYVICLERETKRRKLITNNLDSLGLSAEFVGVDGKFLPEKFADMYSEPEAKTFWGRGLTPGEIGVYASQYTLWEKIAEKQNEIALILESDAVVSSKALHVIERIVSQCNDFDMVMLSWGDCVPSFWGRRAIDAEYSLVRFSRKSFFASAYLLTPSGAKKLLDNSQTIKMPVDELMLGEVVDKGMSIYAIYPRLVYLLDNAYETSTLNDDRKQIASDRGQAEKREKKGLKKVEQAFRHFVMRLRKPPFV